jgi:hypothetical protein
MAKTKIHRVIKTPEKPTTKIRKTSSHHVIVTSRRAQFLPQRETVSFLTDLSTEN